MTDKTLSALKRSIAHWKRMVDGKFRHGESPAGCHCPLCNMFQKGSLAQWCNGCPVMNKTKKPMCHGSPWSDATYAFYNKGKHSISFKEAATLELRFLQSLLPKRKK